MLKFKVTNQKLTLLYPQVVVVADSQDYLQAQFSFSEDWNNVVKIALFSRDDDNIRVALDENNIAVVPWQVLKGKGKFDISVFGNNYDGDANKVITSSVVTLDVKRSGLKDGETFDESEQGLEGGVLWQITHKAQEAQQYAQQAQSAAQMAATDAANAVRSDLQTLKEQTEQKASEAKAAAQTSQQLAQNLTDILNAPRFGYDENGHLNFYYNREV